MIKPVALAVALVPLLGVAPQGASSLQRVMIDIHNRARSEVGAPPVTWDPLLAAGAQLWADHLAAIGRLEHSSSDEGENLAGGAGDFSADQLAQLWIDEKVNFVNGTMPAISRTGRWQDAGHYSQVVWRGTTRIGCATAGHSYLVCRYSPAGNYIGEKAL